MSLKSLSKFKKDLVIVFAIIVGAFLIDFVTKVIVLEKMTEGKSIPIIGDFFQLTFAKNTGAAWSMFSGKMSFLVLMTLLSLAVFCYFLKDVDFKKNIMYSLSISLMIGGTLGNFYDRLFRGYVVDFIHFNFFGYDFPIFNFADIFLVSGVIGLGIYILFLEGKQNENK